jgi:alcohol dehydrogenase YqhD (iron-dependent ADH family)
MFQKLRKRYDKYRYNKAIKRIRNHFSALGFDLNLTDKEIKKGVYEMGRFMTQTGVTTEEAVSTWAWGDKK